jgi:F-type H+-transporting ATPase subunit gamma
MSEVSERVLDRLDNLENIEPLLGSLRILSLSTMQMALNRKALMQTYKDEYYHILSLLQDALPKNEVKQVISDNNVPSGKVLLVVLGSERGICGMYNKNLASLASEWVDAQEGLYQVLTFGEKLRQSLRQLDLAFENQGAMGKGAMPRYQKAQMMVNAWIKEYQRGELREVNILSFRKPTSGFYKPVITQLIPSPEGVDVKISNTPPWPPPIIEGDPLLMIKRTIEHLTAINFYELILESIAAENALRFNLLEEARENTRELIESLVIEVQIAKRQAITQEMLELASGAGLTQ